MAARYGGYSIEAAMIYALTKAAHLLSLFLWIGGMLTVSWCLRFPCHADWKRLKAYDRAVAAPAMVSAWIFGMMLAVQGGWFSQTWLVVKIPLVLLMSGLHGVLAGKLRRYASGGADQIAGKKVLFYCGLVLLTAIVLVATTKG